MPHPKHLVLEDDVHGALSQRRDMTGRTISQLGNSILRSHIMATLHEQLLGEELVSAGYVSEEQYQNVLENVARKTRRQARPGAAALERIGEGRFVSGSLEIQSLLESPVGAFQVLEIWARDTHQSAMTQHTHAGDLYFIMLDGRCLVVMMGTPSVLTKGCIARVPDGVVHSLTPLDDKCHLLALLVPAVPEYSTKATD